MMKANLRQEIPLRPRQPPVLMVEDLMDFIAHAGSMTPELEIDGQVWVIAKLSLDNNVADCSFGRLRDQVRCGKLWVEVVLKTIVTTDDPIIPYKTIDSGLLAVLESAVLPAKTGGK